jgi:alpha/beta superfamily hydrolase
VNVLTAIPIVVTRDIANRHVTFARTWSGEDFGLEPERIALTTTDGLELAAFAVHHPSPRAVVVFLSGAHNPSVTAFFGHAAWLRGHGYAPLLVEMRAHGESEGDRIGLGFGEVQDVQAAVEHLGRDPTYADVPIVAFGPSLGGATAIDATGRIAEIDALVSLSAFSSWSDVLVASMGLPEPFASVQRPFVDLDTSFGYGFDRRTITPKTQIRELDGRPALPNHSREDSQVAFEDFERLVAHAPPHVETWVRDGDAHLIVAEGSFPSPQDDAAYAARVLGFLDRSLGR